MALHVNDLIMERSGTITLNDYEHAEGGNADDEENDDAMSGVIEVMSDYEENTTAKVKPAPSSKATTKDLKKNSAVMKAYCLDDTKSASVTIDNKGNTNDNKGSRTNPAALAISKIGSYFDPDKMRQREEGRTMQSMQLSREQFLQDDLCQSRLEAQDLRQQLQKETRCADTAEMKLEMKEEVERSKIKYKSSRRRRSPSSSSDSHSDRRLRKRRYSRKYSRSPSYGGPSRSCTAHHYDYHHTHNRAHSPSPWASQRGSHSRSPGLNSDVIHHNSRNSGQPMASTSAATLETSEAGMVVRITPKRGKDGQVSSYELSPTKNP